MSKQASRPVRTSQHRWAVRREPASRTSSGRRAAWMADRRRVHRPWHLRCERTRQRPQFNAVLNGVARKDFDLVAAWSVDRLGRSLQHLIGFLNELHAKKVDLYLHQQGIDTTTPAGRAMFSMLGVFGEFERSMIQERVRAGLRRAVAQGKVLGRPMVNGEIEKKVHALRAKGHGMIKIAKAVGIGVGTVLRMVKA